MKLPCGYEAWAGRPVEVALRDHVAVEAEVIDAVAGRASIRDPHLLRPRLEGDVKRVRQQSGARAVSAIEVLIEHGFHESLRRATEGFYDTALNEANGV